MGPAVHVSRLRPAVLALVGLLALGSLVHGLLRIDSLYRLGRAWADPHSGRAHVHAHVPSAALVEWANGNLPADARVLLVGETRRFRLDRRHVVADFLHENPWHAALRADDPVVALRAEVPGVTHVLYCPREERRLLRGDDVDRRVAESASALVRGGRALVRSEECELFVLPTPVLPAPPSAPGQGPGRE